MTIDQLKKALEAADPAAVLVPGHLLARVIREVHDVRGQGTTVPHRKSLIIDRAVLYNHVDQADLDLSSGRLLPPKVILVARPTSEKRGKLDAEATLVRFWRRLFHANVHLGLERRVTEGQLNDAAVAARVAALGAVEFEEIRTVLEEEQYLFPGASTRDVYIEFAAVFLELRYFLPDLLPIMFPAIREPGRVDALLGQDVDAAALFARTRLEGLSEAPRRRDDSDDEPSEACWKLIKAAEQAERTENTVRAAILRTRAARIAPAARTQKLREEVEDDLDHLTKRLQSALKLADTDAKEWRHDLPALLDKTGEEQWSVEARLLYDLQTACIEAEHEVYSLDIVEWLSSLGKKPLRKPLTNQRLVRITHALRSAAERLNATRLSEADRQHLGRLLHDARRVSEERLRGRFRPVLEDALHDVGLAAANAPERAARHKMVEELLDRVVALGFITFSDLRDAISRNNLKLPDIADPQEWVRGDPLLRLDRRLAAGLDGVYRPSEIYLRALQRLTSMNFGTRFGRLLTRYVTIPVLGALLFLQGVDVLLHTYQEVVHNADAKNLKPYVGPASVLFSRDRDRAADAATLTPPPPADAPVEAEEEDDPPEGAGPPPAAASRPPPLTPVEGCAEKPKEERNSPTLHPLEPPWNLVRAMALWALGAAGLFAVLHVPRVRLALRRGAKVCLRGLRVAFVEWPARVLPLAALRRFLRSWAGAMLFDYLLKPLFLWLLLWSLIILVVDNVFEVRLFWWVASFVALALLVNSRPARDVQDIGSRSVAGAVDWLRSDLILGLIRFTTRFFKRALDGLEYVLYTVDEWLRFREGDGRLTQLTRGVLGVLWFPISYVLRLYVVVLLEPFFNPLKMPLSILAAKFVYPIIWGVNLDAHMMGWVCRHVVANHAVAWLLVWGLLLYWLPDAFAFLIWELKENWKLYRANRPDQLQAVGVGPHGETLLDLLHPGIHSGKVPKLYARWRQAERELREGGPRRPAQACREEMAHLEEALRGFVERDVLALLHQAPGWQKAPLRLAAVTVASNLVRFELAHTDHPDEPLRVAVAEQNGWLVARLEDVGWSRHLPEAEFFAWTRALAGLYKLAGVDVVAEDVERQLPEGATWHLEGGGLVVRFGPFDERFYDLSREGEIGPQPPGPPAPTLDADQTLFAHVPLTWDGWVDDWSDNGAAPPPVV